MNIQFRFASAADAAQMLDIYAPFIQKTHTSFETEIPSVQNFSNRIVRVLSEGPWVVAVDDDMVVGYAYAAAHRSRAAYRFNRELSVYLKESYRGRGLGIKLYTISMELLKWQGYTNALAGIALPNAASQAFHEKLGFSAVGIYQDAGYKFGKFWSI